MLPTAGQGVDICREYAIIRTSYKETMPGGETQPGIMGGDGIMFGKHFVGIGGQRLNRYEYTRGGGMSGGYTRMTVERADDRHALVTQEKADGHSDEPVVERYLVDVSVMDRLARIIRRCHMNFWHGKQFTDLFVCDGESKTYRFRFDSSEISFTSQIYPRRYADKLCLLNDIIRDYIGTAAKLPEDAPAGGITPSDGEEKQ